MKYGMNMLLWTSNVTEEHYDLLEQIKGYGYDGVELPLFELDMDNLKKLGSQLDDLGLGRTSVTVMAPETNPISDSAEVRQAALDHLKSVIDAAQAVGATHLCGPIHSALGEFSGAGPTADEWGRAKDVLSAAGDHAQQAGVTLTVEYLNRFECYFLNCAEDCSRFIREIDHSHVKMMYDTFHANIEEKNIAEAIRTCINETVHVHISENDRSTPGEGNIDWDTTFATLKEVGYDSWLTVEAFGLALPELAAATKIWRRMYPSEDHLTKNAVKFMKANT